jgi:triacylglycerol lipase
VTLVDPPSGGTGDLRTQAQVLGTSAKSAIARAHAESVDVIGYSAGGVVARLWVNSATEAPFRPCGESDAIAR